ncbi:hypothetical protein GGR57DRAFT_276216 [Xylariaceae sp. FL1272]|nr:hypothetical protein GGR57DRAFT_276216 [Xylariaceae sp. FL1272]
MSSTIAGEQPVVVLVGQANMEHWKTSIRAHLKLYNLDHLIDSAPSYNAERVLSMDQIRLAISLLCVSISGSLLSSIGSPWDRLITNNSPRELYLAILDEVDSRASFFVPERLRLLLALRPRGPEPVDYTAFFHKFVNMVNELADMGTQIDGATVVGMIINSVRERNEDYADTLKDRYSRDSDGFRRFRANIQSGREECHYSQASPVPSAWRRRRIGVWNGESLAASPEMPPAAFTWGDWCATAGAGNDNNDHQTGGNGTATNYDETGSNGRPTTPVWSDSRPGTSADEFGWGHTLGCASKDEDTTYSTSGPEQHAHEASGWDHPNPDPFEWEKRSNGSSLPGTESNQWW